MLFMRFRLPFSRRVVGIGTGVALLAFASATGWSQSERDRANWTGAVVMQAVSVAESLGLNRSERAAKAELARVTALPDRKLVRAGLLRMIVSPDPRWASETHVLAQARQLYGRDYSSPWLSAVQSHTMGPRSTQRSANQEFDYQLYSEIGRAIRPLEHATYARMDPAAVELLFAPESAASQAFARLTKRIDAEEAAFAAWKGGSFWGRDSRKQSYDAAVAAKPSRAELIDAFVSAAYPPPPTAAPVAPVSGSEGDGTPAFDELPLH